MRNCRETYLLIEFINPSHGPFAIVRVPGRYQLPLFGTIPPRQFYCTCARVLAYPISSNPFCTAAYLKYKYDTSTRDSAHAIHNTLAGVSLVRANSPASFCKVTFAQLLVQSLSLFVRDLRGGVGSQATYRSCGNLSRP